MPPSQIRSSESWYLSCSLSVEATVASRYDSIFFVLFPEASEVFNHMAFLLIGCGLAFGTQINAC